MGFGKNFAVSVLTFILLISLSIAIVSLTFSIILTERTLISLADQEVQPFIEEQVDAALEGASPTQMESEHRLATQMCERGETYELHSGDGEPIEVDCEAIEESEPDEFKNVIKESLVDHTMASVMGGLDEASSRLNYIAISLWISVAISFILIFIIILVEGKFPFKIFGTTGMIAGLPFVMIIFSKTFIISKMKEEIGQMLPPETLDFVLQSSLFQAITDIIRNLLNSMALGFALLFLTGLILLLVGVFTTKKQSNKIFPANQPPTHHNI